MYLNNFLSVVRLNQECEAFAGREWRRIIQQINQKRINLKLERLVKLNISKYILAIMGEYKAKYIVTLNFIFTLQEFTHENDTCYLAHCYPYTFTDLKDHLDMLMSEPERRRCMKREVLCESRAGNSCFLLTISNFSGRYKGSLQ